MMTYANSSIIVSFLDVAFDYNNNIYVYNCSNDSYKDDQVNVNINNINNKHMLVMKNGKPIPASTILNVSLDASNQYTQFIGFVSNGNILYSVFAYKNYSNDAFGKYDSSKSYSKILQAPRLKLRYATYKCHTPVIYSEI